MSLKEKVFYSLLDASSKISYDTEKYGVTLRVNGSVTCREFFLNLYDAFFYFKTADYSGLKGDITVTLRAITKEPFIQTDPPGFPMRRSIQCHTPI